MSGIQDKTVLNFKHPQYQNQRFTNNHIDDLLLYYFKKKKRNLKTIRSFYHVCWFIKDINHVLFCITSSLDRKFRNFVQILQWRIFSCWQTIYVGKSKGVLKKSKVSKKFQVFEVLIRNFINRSQKSHILIIFETTHR